MGTKRKAGKPKSPLTEQIWARCTPNEKANFQWRAVKEGRELSAHIRFCLQQYEISKKSKKE